MQKMVLSLFENYSIFEKVFCLVWIRSNRVVRPIFCKKKMNLEALIRT